MAGNSKRAGRETRGASSAELSVAVEHHRAGRLDKAEALYRRFLRKFPAHPDALHLLGVVALARGNPNRAIDLIGKAIIIMPDFAQSHSNLGNALRAAGRLADACASYRRAIALKPDFAAAHSNLGLVLCEQGEFAAATESCERGVHLDPLSSEAHTNLGNALRRMGRLPAAEASLRQAARLNSSSVAAQIDLADILVELRKFAEAETLYRHTIDRSPRSARAHCGLAACLRAAGDIDLAIKHYREALAIRPSEASIWNDLGRCSLALGRLAEAVEAFRRALSIDPDLADAYRNLASCRALSIDGPEMARTAALAGRVDLPIETRATAGFAIAKALDDAERYDEAFAAYDSANHLYRQARAAAGDRFDAVDLAHRVDGLIADFTPAFFTSVVGWGNPSELPVFVVGLPRSGTTLVEQIAASHSRVFGAGELRNIGEIAAELGPPDSPWTQAAMRRAADAHLDRLRGLGRGRRFVVDKMPDNIFMLGLIASLYPSARIIFCRRDPRDVGVSCYFQKFSPGLLTFSYDLSNCGQRIRETTRLAAHWRSVVPLRCLEIGYESLIANPERESRRLIEFLDLQWEPACLDFHRTARIVQTASSWQIRQPLYQRSVGRWRHFEKYLDPLLRELDYSGGVAYRQSQE